MIKSADEFSPNKSGKYGLYARCKPCTNEVNRSHREQRAEREGRIYYPRPTTEDERQERIKVSKRRAYLKSRFNMSLEDYENMLSDQDYCCAICKRHRDEFGQPLGVDHDRHCCAGYGSCGNCIRALLCLGCNTGIGVFHESPEALQQAISYLEKYALV